LIGVWNKPILKQALKFRAGPKKQGRQKRRILNRDEADKGDKMSRPAYFGVHSWIIYFCAENKYPFAGRGEN
jgi:hypothetical protein